MGATLRRIGILGACDTGGMVLAMTALLPDSEIKPLKRPQEDEGQLRTWLAEVNQTFDCIFVNNLVQTSDLWQEALTQTQLVAYPHIHFHAFAPDMTYAFRLVDGQQKLIEPSYNSSICLWGFLNGISPERTVKLFNDQVFADLGYYELWPQSVADLQQQFVAHGLDFRRFLLKVKRDGVFMLSHNHPKINAIIAQAKCLVIDKLGGPAELANWPVYAIDSLAGLYWPTYPEIGAFYGQHTVYNFPFKGKVMGLEEYVQEIFAHYETLGLHGATMRFSRSRDRLDRVLTAHTAA